MPKQKTETEVFVETCAGVYRAITELDQVARPHGGDDLQREAWKATVALQVEAWKATGALQKTLDMALKYWNEESGLSRVRLCASVGNFYLTAKCEIYVAGNIDLTEPGGYCAECLLAEGRS